MSLEPQHSHARVALAMACLKMGATWRGIKSTSRRFMLAI